jgi:hypothetical protein
MPLRYYSIGAPYIALASDWLPIATNWTNLMPMAVRKKKKRGRTASCRIFFPLF